MNGDNITFTLTVTDEGQLQSSDRCTINILPVNKPPAANAGTDQTVNEGVSVILNGAGSSDPDGDALTFSWTQVSGPVINLNDPSAKSPVFNAPAFSPGGNTLIFQLTVTDEIGLNSIDQCSVTIIDSSSVDLTGAWGFLTKYWNWAERKYILSGRFSVQNKGDSLNKPFNVSFYLSTDTAYSTDDVLIFNQSITSIGANESVNINLDRIKSNYLIWRNYVICKIDNDNTISEDSENNNMVASGIYFNFWSMFSR